MKELNLSEIEQVSGGMDPVLAIVIIVGYYFKYISN